MGGGDGGNVNKILSLRKTQQSSFVETGRDPATIKEPVHGTTLQSIK